jgi:hypothetical protein
MAHHPLNAGLWKFLAKSLKHRSLLQEIRAFNRASLRHVDTIEKINLPDAKSK